MANGAKLRVMVDTNVLVSGITWPRWPYEILRASLRQNFQLVICPYILDEARRNIRDHFPKNSGRLEIFLALAHYEPVPDPSPDEVTKNQGLVRDETDIPVALAAINAGVDYLVSEDKDLTAHDDTTKELQKRLPVLLSGTFLRQVLGWTSEDLEEIRHRTWSDLQK